MIGKTKHHNTINRDVQKTNKEKVFSPKFRKTLKSEKLMGKSS